MKYIHRILEKKLDEYLHIFPVIAVTGPRQSGKSTLLKYFPGSKYTYVTFDDPLLLNFFYSDPKDFLHQYNNHIIFDEVQKVPELFPYLKMEVDRERQNYGKYVVTGSSQFSLLKHITESLAGRIGLLSLLPFQYSEIPESMRKNQLIYGSYPELVTREYTHYTEWFASYVSTYIDRDVRTLFNIGNLRDFHKLIQLLAARCSQELNMSSLSKEIGISIKTVQSWISVLEASYIIFLLPSYHKNLGKRIVKRPKLYFYDTGIICYLTGIPGMDILNRGPLAGPVFENYIVAEVKKTILHNSVTDQLYYYRSNSSLEADLIIEDSWNNEQTYIEIKNNSTPRYKMIENIRKIMDLDTSQKKTKGLLVHRGTDEGAFSDSIKYINYKTFFNRISLSTNRKSSFT